MHNSGSKILRAPPRFLIIGAGARGNAYARAVTESTNGIIAAVAEPITFKRELLGRNYIWRDTSSKPEQAFVHWREFLDYEQQRRNDAAKGTPVPTPIDGVFICTLDEMHAEIIVGLTPLDMHLMCEKPLATTWKDCLRIYRALQPAGTAESKAIFSIGHVLRYSPHNQLLRKLLLEDRVIGSFMSIEHTEPVGWWHFSHSYVRGNWRKEASTAPSLLTKSCHDIDFLLWLLCSPIKPGIQPPHLPAYVTSTGSLVYFRRHSKPDSAGHATNCLSCAAENECMYSAKKIYYDHHLQKGNTGWPVHIVDPEIEDCWASEGVDAARERLMKQLCDNYDETTPQVDIDRRPWFGRCVYEADNDVCDDQVVTISLEDDPLPVPGGTAANAAPADRSAKTAIFHMVAFTEAQCERRGRIYGSKGEIEYNSKSIRVYDFATRSARVHHPHQPGGGHGGGDDGLAGQFVKAVCAVKNEHVAVEEAQALHIGCTLEEVIRSHAMVFAAEEARRTKTVVHWQEWWQRNVESTG